jgi:hypothetical protein
LFKALATETDEQTWARICRLSANFCTDRMNIRNLLRNGNCLTIFGIKVIKLSSFFC